MADSLSITSQRGPTSHRLENSHCEARVMADSLRITSQRGPTSHRLENSHCEARVMADYPQTICFMSAM